MITETFSNMGIGEATISNAGVAKIEVTGLAVVQVLPGQIALNSEVILKMISGPGESTFVRADGSPFFDGKTEYIAASGPIILTAEDLIAGIKANSSWDEFSYSVEYYIPGSQLFTDRLKRTEQEIRQIAQALGMPVQDHVIDRIQVDKNQILADSIVTLTYTAGPGSNTFLTLDEQPVKYYNSGTTIEQVEEYVPVAVSSEALIAGIKLQNGGAFRIEYYAPVQNGRLKALEDEAAVNRDDIAMLKSFIGLPPSGEPLPDLVFTNDGKCYPPHMVVPDGVQSIETDTYKGLPYLKSVKFSDTVTTIGANAFQGCTGLNRVDFSPSITKIAMYAFQDCTGLATLNFPKNLKTVDKYSFSGCTGLTGKITLPDSVSFLGQEAFSNCENMTEINIPKMVSYISAGCFMFTGLREVTVPGYISMIDGYAYDTMQNLTKFYMEHGVTNIRDYGLRNCPLLTDIYIPNTLTKLGAHVFSGCPLIQNITIEDGFRGTGLNLSGCQMLSAETLVGIFHALADLTEESTVSLTLGSGNLGKLTDEQKEIATNKNWVLA